VRPAAGLPALDHGPAAAGFGLRCRFLPLHGGSRWLQPGLQPVAMQSAGWVSKLGLWPACVLPIGMMGEPGPPWGPGHRRGWAWCRRCRRPQCHCQTDIAPPGGYSSLGPYGPALCGISAASPLSLQGACQTWPRPDHLAAVLSGEALIETRTGTTEIAGFRTCSTLPGAAFHQRPVPVGPDGFSRGGLARPRFVAEW